MTLVLVIGLGVGLGVLQNVFRAQGRLDPISGTLQAITRPAVAGLDATFDTLGEFGQGVRDARRLRRENENLRNQLQVLSLYMESAEAGEREFDRLRRLMNLEVSGRTKVYADIVAYVDFDKRITLNVGSDQGVRPNLAVVTADGILAVISTVERRSSQATLVTSRSVQLGGLAQGSPSVAGLLRGVSVDRLVMDIFEPIDVAVGTTVVTTGYSEFIPRGLRIGTVVEFVKDEQFGVRQAQVLPAARIGLGREVAVLK